MRCIQFIGGWRPLSVALLVMVILNYKEIHGAPFEVPGRRERLSRGDRDKLGKRKNENGRWGGGIPFSKGNTKERRIYDEFPEDFDYWQHMEGRRRGQNHDNTHGGVGDSDRRLPYLHSITNKPNSSLQRSNGGLAQLLSLRVSPMGALMFTLLGAISRTWWQKVTNECNEEIRWDNHRVQLQLLEDKLQALEGEKCQLEKVTRERVVEAEAHQLEIETLRKEIRETENLRNEMNSYRSEVDTLRNKANEVETLRNEMNSYRSEADTIRKEANESEILRMEIDAYRSESDNLRKEVNGLKTDVEVLSLAKESAEELATVAADEMSGLRNRLEAENERKAVWVGSAALSVMGLNRTAELEQYIYELKTEILNLGTQLVFEREQAVKEEERVRLEKEKEYAAEISKLEKQRDVAIETERARLQQQIEELMKRLEAVKDLVRRKLHEKWGKGKAAAAGISAPTPLQGKVDTHNIAGMQ
eukprot:450320_1